MQAQVFLIFGDRIFLSRSVDPDFDLFPIIRKYAGLYRNACTFKHRPFIIVYRFWIICNLGLAQN